MPTSKKIILTIFSLSLFIISSLLYEDNIGRMRFSGEFGEDYRFILDLTSAVCLIICMVGEWIEKRKGLYYRALTIYTIILFLDFQVWFYWIDELYFIYIFHIVLLSGPICIMLYRLVRKINIIVMRWLVAILLISAISLNYTRNLLLDELLHATIVTYKFESMRIFQNLMNWFYYSGCLLIIPLIVKEVKRIKPPSIKLK